MFPLQHGLAAVAYVNMQRLYGHGMVRLCKPRTTACEVLRDALMSV